MGNFFVPFNLKKFVFVVVCYSVTNNSASPPYIQEHPGHLEDSFKQTAASCV